MEKIIISKSEPVYLLVFEKEGKKAYFDYKDGKWQFWGELKIDESAKLFFEKLGKMFDLRIKEYAKQYVQKEKKKKD